MTFPKGKSGNLSGRPKGSSGKANSDIKATFQLFIERNVPKMDKWINDLAEDNPGAALNCIMKMAEFIIPRIKAMEQIVEPVKPFEMLIDDTIDMNQAEFNINWVDDEDSDEAREILAELDIEFPEAYIDMNDLKNELYDKEFKRRMAERYPQIAISQ